MTSFLIVGDISLIRKGFQYLIEDSYPDSVIFEASNLDLAGKIVNDENIDVIILDLELRDSKLLQFSIYVKNKYPNLKIVAHLRIINTIMADKRYKIPAKCFLNTREETVEQIEQSFKIVMSGGYYMSVSLRELIADVVINETWSGSQFVIQTEY